MYSYTLILPFCSGSNIFSTIKITAHEQSKQCLSTNKNTSSLLRAACTCCDLYTRAACCMHTYCELYTHVLRAACTRAASCIHTYCELYTHVLRAACTRAASWIHVLQAACTRAARFLDDFKKTNHLYEFIGEVILKIDLV